MKMCLNNNQLKLVALVCMTVDHVGMVLYPQYLWLRAVGRLAMPIFAYMIAEGCSYTRSVPKYLGVMAAVAALCQAVYYVAMDSLYQCILVTFSLSVCVIATIHKAQKTKKPIWWLCAVVAVAAVYFVTVVLPKLLPATDFAVDYGFWGVLLPVLVYLGRNRTEKLLLTGVGSVLLTLDAWVGQWYALLALPLLALYDGSRGKWKLKWLFYIYYPAHLVLIQAAAVFWY